MPDVSKGTHMFESPRGNSVGLKRAVFIFLGLLITASAFAQDQNSDQAARPQSDLQKAPMIFDVRRSLPMEPTEPVYHDFYINAGLEAGFKKGMFITVTRLIPIHDPVRNIKQGELEVGIARLQVIHSASSLSVARLYSEFTNEERPAVEFEAVMIGDRIDPASGTMKAPGVKKKTALTTESHTNEKEEPKETVALEAPAQPVIEKVEVSAAPVAAPSAEATGTTTTVTMTTTPPEKTSQEVPPTGIVRLPVPAGAGVATVGKSVNSVTSSSASPTL